jgi:bla regulator protein blaR1
VSSPVLHTLLSLSVVTSCALLLVLAIRAPLRRFGGAGLAYAAWLIVPLVVLTHLLSDLLPLPGPSLFAVNTTMPKLARSLASEAMPTPLLYVNGVLFLWLAGCFIATCLLAWQQVRFVRSLGQLADYAHESGGSARTQLATHCHIGPVLVGLLRPRIVLPQDFERRYTQPEQRLILAHERVHLRRGDLFINAIAAILRILFWFNPLMHWAAQRMRLDQELACDAAVLAQAMPTSSSKQVYASAILKSALINQNAALACHWQSRHPVTERIMNFNIQPPRRAARRATQISLAAIALGACLGASGNAAPAPGPNQYRIDFTYAGSTSDATDITHTYHSTFSMIQEIGKPAVFKPANESASPCAFIVTATPMKDDQVHMDIPFACNGSTDHIKIIALFGQKASFETTQGEAPAPRTVHHVTLVVTR